ncbi:MAG: hypothetical protein AABY22_35430 [Nanoarchaeota archaeon]
MEKIFDNVNPEIINSEFVLLKDLPADHPIRNNKLLKEINAECRNLKSKIWRNVSSWKIGKNTYNQLGNSWIEFSEFRCNKTFL